MCEGMEQCEKAKELARQWCKKHRGWKPVCDIEDTSKYYHTWETISDRKRGQWEQLYPGCAEGAWDEFGHDKCRVKTKYMHFTGRVYDRITSVPFPANAMLMMQVGRLPVE